MNTTFDLSKTIAIGSDHAGFEYKQQILKYLTDKNLLTTDVGCYNTSSMDYPDIAHPVATMVQNNEAAFGILLCGSANGVCITANKHNGVRAALCWQKEIAELSRLHNNANILCMPARFTTIEECIAMLETFMNTSFEGGRHETRVDKIKLA
jgi:ribose 5-phosphate isomerase B